MNQTTTTLTLAQQFQAATAKRYRYDLESFKWSAGPDPLAYRKPKIVYVRYCVNFVDGSSVHVIMTDRQRDHIQRSKLWHTIRNVGGEGYKQLI